MKLNVTQANAVTDEIVAKLKEKRQKETEEFFKSSEGQILLDALRHNLNEYKRQMDIQKDANVAANRCKDQIDKHMKGYYPRYLDDMSIEDLKSEMNKQRSIVEYFEKEAIHRQVTIAGIKGVGIEDFINDMVNRL